MRVRLKHEAGGAHACGARVLRGAVSLAGGEQQAIVVLAAEIALHADVEATHQVVEVAHVAVGVVDKGFGKRSANRHATVLVAIVTVVVVVVVGACGTALDG